jgi:hypothetical protein
MTMTQTVAKALQISDDADRLAFFKSDQINKPDSYDALNRLAQKGRREGESASQAFARYTRDPVGKLLLNAHLSKGRGRSYQSPEPVAKVVDTTAAQLAAIRKLIYKNSDEGAIDDSDSRSDRPAEQLEKLVTATMAKFPHMTKTSAYSHVLSTPQGQACLRQDKARTMAR